MLKTPRHKPTLLKQAKRAFLQTLKTTGFFSIVKNSRWRQNRLLILAFHGVSTFDEHLWNPELYCTPEHLRERFEMLKQGNYTVLPLQEAVLHSQNGTLPPRAVAITFDDGGFDFYYSAFPIIKEFGFPVTIYQTTYYSQNNFPIFTVAVSYILWKSQTKSLDLQTLIGQSQKVSLHELQTRLKVRKMILDFAESERLSGSEKHEILSGLALQLDFDLTEMTNQRRLCLMNPDEIREISDAGIDVQLHTHRHQTPDERELFLQELVENRNFIEKWTNRKAFHFCYPNGICEPQFLPWLQELNIKTATTCSTDLTNRQTDVLILPRLVDTSFLAPIEFEGWLVGVSAFLPRKKFWK